MKTQINLSAIKPIDLDAWLSDIADDSISVEELEYGFLDLCSKCGDYDELKKHTWIFTNPAAFKQWCIQNVPTMDQSRKDELDRIRHHAPGIANALSGYNEIISGRVHVKDFP